MTLGRVKVTVAGVDGCKAGLGRCDPVSWRVLRQWQCFAVSPILSRPCRWKRSLLSTCRSVCRNSVAKVGEVPRWRSVPFWGNVSRASSQSLRGRPSTLMLKSSRASNPGTRGIVRQVRFRERRQLRRVACRFQAFGIFSKIREIDTLLRMRPDLSNRISRIASGGRVLPIERWPCDVAAEEDQRDCQPRRDGGAKSSSQCARLRAELSRSGAAGGRSFR